MEKPFFTYDPIQEQEIVDDISDNGISMMGIDILPSEVPRESSEHFGQAVQTIIEEFINVRVNQDDHTVGIDPTLLSTRLVRSYFFKLMQYI
jgi:alpha-aminoadipic semialdehyde synthase